MGKSESDENVQRIQQTSRADRNKFSLFKSQHVIVYLWTTKSLGGRGRSGHVAVEIVLSNERGTQLKNTYISLWPPIDLESRPEKWPPGRVRPTFTSSGERWSLVEDYTGDRLLERRRPEYIFRFYTLDFPNIMMAFKIFKTNSATAYNMLGDYVQKVDSDDQLDIKELGEEKKHLQQSCVSLACLTLDAGGINRWLTKEDKYIASSAGTSDMSRTQSEQSKDALRNLNIIQPSENVAYYILEQLISGYVMSPDVLLHRLKIAKRKEWESKDGAIIQQLGRMTCHTKISKDGKTKDVTFSSSQDLNIRVSHPTPTSEENPDPNCPDAVNETTFEWLPLDEKRFQTNKYFLNILSKPMGSGFAITMR